MKSFSKLFIGAVITLGLFCHTMAAAGSSDSLEVKAKFNLKGDKVSSASKSGKGTRSKSGKKHKKKKSSSKKKTSISY